MDTSMFKAAFSGETVTPAGLITGPDPVLSDYGLVATGQDLAAFTVVGRENTNGTLVAWTPDATDGSEVAIGILAEAVDASAEDISAPFYRGGCFDPDMLVWPEAIDNEPEKLAAFDRTPIRLRRPA